MKKANANGSAKLENERSTLPAIWSVPLYWYPRAWRRPAPTTCCHNPMNVHTRPVAMRIDTSRSRSRASSGHRQIANASKTQ